MVEGLTVAVGPRQGDLEQEVEQDAFDAFGAHLVVA